MIASKEWVKDLLKKCFNKNNEYSTTEKRIGTWIDGKPIYRKVIAYTLPSKTGSSTSNARISIAIIPNVDSITNMIGVLDNKNNSSLYKTHIPFSTQSTGIDFQFGYNSDSLDLVVYRDAIPALTEITCILEYTKTTD